MIRVAALYVRTGGTYYGLPDVDPWDAARDARRYTGADPVVAHPPCNRWSSMASITEVTCGYLVGYDGGTFCHALWAVRRFGGVLEHPAYSRAWRFFALPHPDSAGGWSAPDAYGGRSCYIEQNRYGHRLRKPTYLYAAHVAFPELHWGRTPKPPGELAFCGTEGVRGQPYNRIPSAIRLYTPEPFRDLLIDMARTVRGPVHWLRSEKAAK